MRGVLGSRRWLGAAISLAAFVLVLAVGSARAGQGSHRARASEARATVAIKGFKYKPATLRIRRGTEVVFVNRDRVSHTATRRGSFNTGRIRPGRSESVRFGRRGTYRYVCTIHPFMHGKIVVR